MSKALIDWKEVVLQKLAEMAFPSEQIIEGLNIKVEAETIRFNLDQVGLYECVVTTDVTTLTTNEVIGESLTIPGNLSWEPVEEYTRYRYLQEYIGQGSFWTAFQVIDVLLQCDICLEQRTVFVDPFVYNCPAEESLWINYRKGIHVFIRRKGDPAGLLPTASLFAWFDAHRAIMTLPKYTEDLVARVENERVVIEATDGTYQTGIYWRNFAKVFC